MTSKEYKEREERAFQDFNTKIEQLKKEFLYSSKYKIGQFISNGKVTIKIEEKEIFFYSTKTVLVLYKGLSYTGKYSSLKRTQSNRLKHIRSDDKIEAL